MWLNQNFLLAKELDFKAGFIASFISLRNNQEISIQVESGGGITIKTHDMDLAGDLVQSICHFLNVTDLEVNYKNNEILLIFTTVESITQVMSFPLCIYYFIYFRQTLSFPMRLLSWICFCGLLMSIKKVMSGLELKLRTSRELSNPYWYELKMLEWLMICEFRKSAVKMLLCWMRACYLRNLLVNSQ